MAEGSTHRDEGASEVLSDSVYERLRRGIATGLYPPGSKLTERELAAEFDVSRAPIRAAINRLEFTGFVRLAPRRTAIITEVTRADVEELYDLRAALEPVVARVAATRVAGGASPEGLHRALAAAADAISRDDRESLDRANARLHAEIPALAQHRLFDQTFAPLQDRSDRISSLTISTDPGERHAEHAALVAAIASGNGELAAASAFTHVEYGRLRTLRLLAE